MWNFVYRVRSIFTSRRDLCKTMWKKQPDSSIQNNWRGCVSSGWFRDSIHLYVHICVKPDRWLSYRHNSRFLLLRICFCVKMSVQAGEIGGISDNKTLNAPWKGYVWNTTMTTDCSSSNFYFRDYFFFLVIAVSFIDKANSLLFISFCVPGYPLKSGMSCVFIWGTLQWLSLHFVLSKLFHTLCFP